MSVPTHSRKASGHQQSLSASIAKQTSDARHQRTSSYTQSSLQRLPSSSSATSASLLSTRSRRATNPSTPTTLTPSQVSTATSSSYLSPQQVVSGKDARSPATRRPPASFSNNGIDTSRGPPPSIITRRTGDLGRRSSLSSPDYTHAQQTSRSSSAERRRRKAGAEDAGSFTPQPLQPQTQTSTLSRQTSTRTTQRPRHMASSVDESSEYDSGRRSRSEDRHANNGRRRATGASGTDGEQGEDLFMHIAEDNATRESAAEAASRADRLRSRIARVSTRQSLPYSSSPAPPSSATPVANGRGTPSSIDTKSARRNSLLLSSSRTQREPPPLTPTYPSDTSRSRLVDQSPKAPVSSVPKTRDQDLSPRQFLSQMGRRRPSNPDAMQTPPSRAQTYRPSNLQYTSSRDYQETPHVDPAQDAPSRVDGTESLDDSTGPAASVWDELDDLKTRIRKIELGGKIPTTSGALVANATAERPRTANTSITTASSSPQQQRKTDMSSADSTVGSHVAKKAHPVLREALAKAKQCVSPVVFRVLEATATEAIALAELTASAGPQGTPNGASVPDRQVRRKADNICRSLQELCIELCNTKPSLGSPAVRTTATPNSRRPSIQINAESPLIRQSIEPESNTLPRSSPSRAMDRIHARRTSMLSIGLNGSSREPSQEPPTPSLAQMPSQSSRAGTSLQRTRRLGDDDEDPIMRAPSRAMTDFRDIRAPNTASRFPREYTPRESMMELQPSPALQQTTSARRPTVTGVGNDNHLLFRTNNDRFNLNRQSSPAYERQVADRGSRLQYNSNRNSTGAMIGLGRTASLSTRLRGNGAEE